MFLFLFSEPTKNLTHHLALGWILHQRALLYLYWLSLMFICTNRTEWINVCTHLSYDDVIQKYLASKDTSVCECRAKRNVHLHICTTSFIHAPKCQINFGDQCFWKKLWRLMLVNQANVWDQTRTLECHYLTCDLKLFHPWPI